MRKNENACLVCGKPLVYYTKPRLMKCEFCQQEFMSYACIAQNIMEDPFIYMHGPEHHTMVGAALLTAYKNAGGDIDLKSALAEMHERGKQYPGGSCGFWGCCGAAVSVGMFISIITDTTPLSSKTWGWSNDATSRALAKIASYGGPRCCKRNSFTAILAAAEFVSEKMGIEMKMPEKITCTFSGENHECIGKRCPYNLSRQL